MRVPEEMHPLVKRVAIEVRRGPLSDAALERLRVDVLALDGESLRDCVRELIYVATVLEEAGRPEIAAPLFALVESRPVITSLDRANATRLAIGGESVVLAAKKFAKFAAKKDGPRRLHDDEIKDRSELGIARFAGLRLR